MESTFTADAVIRREESFSFSAYAILVGMVYTGPSIPSPRNDESVLSIGKKSMNLITVVPAIQLQKVDN